MKRDHENVRDVVRPSVCICLWEAGVPDLCVKAADRVLCGLAVRTIQCQTLQVKISPYFYEYANMPRRNHGEGCDVVGRREQRSAYEFNIGRLCTAQPPVSRAFGGSVVRPWPTLTLPKHCALHYSSAGIYITSRLQ